MTKLTPANESETRPITLPQAVTSASAGRVVDAPTRASTPACREHGWVTTSRHRTSLGTVVYTACARCGAHRAELQKPRALFPAPITRAVQPHPPIG